MEVKKYIDPEMEVTLFESEDVITTSGGNGIPLPEDPIP